MQIELIENIEPYVKEETGEVILKIQPKKFASLSNEESGQLVLNEVLNILSFNPIEVPDEVLADDEFLKENL